MLDKFLEWQKSNGLKDVTIKNYRMNLNPMNEFKPLDEWTHEDAIQYILKIQEIYKPSTIESAKIIMKVYFKWLKKPEVTDNIKIKNIKNNLKREDILTVEDIQKLIEATPSPLYKALIAFLFESGARIKEILNIKVMDIQDTNIGMIINIPQTKTGNDQRQMLCSLACATHIRNHLTYADPQPEDKLFNLVNVATWRQLMRIAKIANITKKVNPHAFRHAHATDMVLRGYNESVIKKQLGWQKDSRMIGRYEHINNNDVVNAMAEKMGFDNPKTIIKNLNPPESLKIANASLKIKKLEDENEEIKKELNDSKENSNNVSVQLKELSKEFEKLKMTQEHTNMFLKLVESGFIKPNEIKALVEIKPDEDMQTVNYNFDDSKEADQIFRKFKAAKEILSEIETTGDFKRSANKATTGKRKREDINETQK